MVIKYQGFQENGSNYQWPGTVDGYPVVGNAGLLKQEELEEVPVVSNFKSGRFELWDPEQKAAFDTIYDKALDGWFQIMYRENHWNEEHGAPIVWLEWREQHGQVPERLARRGGF